MEKTDRCAVTDCGQTTDESCNSLLDYLMLLLNKYSELMSI